MQGIKMPLIPTQSEKTRYVSAARTRWRPGTHCQFHRDSVQLRHRELLSAVSPKTRGEQTGAAPVTPNSGIRATSREELETGAAVAMTAAGPAAAGAGTSSRACAALTCAPKVVAA